MRLENFAARLLLELPTANILAPANEPPPVQAIWIAYLYGYSYSHSDQVVYTRGTGGRTPFGLHFVRNVEDPEALRRAAWMRDPASDPSYPPPVAWQFGGSGFNPPGWRSDVRLIEPADHAVSAPAMIRELEREAGLRPGDFFGEQGELGPLRIGYNPAPLRARQVHPPGPPPDSLA